MMRQSGGKHHLANSKVTNSAMIRKLAKKEIEIEGMSPQELVNELKQMGIPTYGTHPER